MDATNEYDAVFFEAFEEEEASLRRYLPKNRRFLFTWKTIQEHGAATPPAPVISTRTQSVFPPIWAPQLTAIVTRSTGYDHVTAYLPKTVPRIPAAYLPDYAARAVAEQAMILWSSLLRNIELQRESFQTFHRDGLTGREIKGRTIVVVGVGRIGSQIIDIAHGLGMKLIGVDIAPNGELAKKYGITYLTLDAALAKADVAVSALPLTPMTRGLLDYEALSELPPHAVFVNVGRGEVSPTEDLLRLLKEDKLAGLGLDVYEHEQDLALVLRGGTSCETLSEPARSSVKAALELMTHNRTLLTPHNAFNTEESVERKSQRTAENIQAFLDTGTFLTPIP